MLIMLTLRTDYHFEVEVEAVLLDGQVKYKAMLPETAFVSHFDNFAPYEGLSIELAITAIANALEQAIAKLSEY